MVAEHDHLEIVIPAAQTFDERLRQAVRLTDEATEPSAFRPELVAGAIEFLKVHVGKPVFRAECRFRCLDDPCVR